MRHPRDLPYGEREMTARVLNSSVPPPAAQGHDSSFGGVQHGHHHRRRPVASGHRPAGAAGDRAAAGARELVEVLHRGQLKTAWSGRFRSSASRVSDALIRVSQPPIPLVDRRT